MTRLICFCHNHHSDSKNAKNEYIKLKNNGTLTNIPEDQVKIQSDFLGKEIFGINAPYNDDGAVNDLT